MKKPKKIISTDTSNKINTILRKVVTSKHGTASLADKDGYFIGGKTGTAESYGDKKIELIRLFQFFQLIGLTIHYL